MIYFLPIQLDAVPADFGIMLLGHPEVGMSEHHGERGQRNTSIEPELASGLAGYLGGQVLVDPGNVGNLQVGILLLIADSGQMIAVTFQDRLGPGE